MLNSMAVHYIRIMHDMYTLCTCLVLLYISCTADVYILGVLIMQCVYVYICVYCTTSCAGTSTIMQDLLLASCSYVVDGVLIVWACLHAVGSHIYHVKILYCCMQVFNVYAPKSSVARVTCMPILVYGSTFSSYRYYFC